MSYGITKESQLIDINTIKSGCESFKKILDDFDESGKCVREAGNLLTENALSIDDNTLQYPVCDLGDEISNQKQIYTKYADEVISEAVRVYNLQVHELNEYREEQAKKNSQ